jgi:plasmid stabilization system protein ParE
MIVEWSPVALRELGAIADNLADRNPAAADKVEGEIIDAALSLNRFPQRGRLSRIAGLRELKVRNRRKSRDDYAGGSHLPRMAAEGIGERGLRVPDCPCRAGGAAHTQGNTIGGLTECPTN